jgi:enamine deaminase RidA (YjgF/YER057c/UK114 family)
VRSPRTDWARGGLRVGEQRRTDSYWYWRESAAFRDLRPRERGYGRAGHSLTRGRARCRDSNRIRRRACGEKNAAEYGYSQVMKIDGRVELSGHCGRRPDTLDFPAGVSIEAEIQQAFDNVAFMLKAVGLDCSNVAHVNSCHVPEPDGTILARRLRWLASSSSACRVTSQPGRALASPGLAIPA